MFTVFSVLIIANDEIPFHQIKFMGISILLRDDGGATHLKTSLGGRSGVFVAVV